MGSIISQVYLKINPFFLKSQGEKRILTNIFGFLIARLLIATNIAQQMNQNIPLARSRSLTVGLFLSLVSLGSFLYFLSQKTWLTATAIQREEKRTTTSPIEEVLTFLIKDFVVERQLKRESLISSTPEA